MLNINLHVLKVNVNDRKSTDCIKSGWIKFEIEVGIYYIYDIYVNIGQGDKLFE